MVTFGTAACSYMRQLSDERSMPLLPGIKKVAGIFGAPRQIQNHKRGLWCASGVEGPFSDSP